MVRLCPTIITCDYLDTYANAGLSRTCSLARWRAGDNDRKRTNYPKSMTSICLVLTSNRGGNHTHAHAYHMCACYSRNVAAITHNNSGRGSKTASNRVRSSRRSFLCPSAVTYLWLRHAHTQFAISIDDFVSPVLFFSSETS